MNLRIGCSSNCCANEFVDGLKSKTLIQVLSLKRVGCTCNINMFPISGFSVIFRLYNGVQAIRNQTIKAAEMKFEMKYLYSRGVFECMKGCRFYLGIFFLYRFFSFFLHISGLSFLFLH